MTPAELVNALAEYLPDGESTPDDTVDELISWLDCTARWLWMAYRLPPAARPPVERPRLLELAHGAIRPRAGAAVVDASTDNDRLRALNGGVPMATPKPTKARKAPSRSLAKRERRAHSAEAKLIAVGMVRKGMTRRAAAQQVDVVESVLRNWERQFAEAGDRVPKNWGYVPATAFASITRDWPPLAHQAEPPPTASGPDPATLRELDAIVAAQHRDALDDDVRRQDLPVSRPADRHNVDEDDARDRAATAAYGEY